ncbi:hypothetical protein BGX38DRAFT_1145451 [Terfezia claveryi]|nr:hypothetical protein BGX38DRAFT_1145451 [Terfezia claveryi]
MSQYLRRQRDGERHGRLQEEEDLYALPNARRGNVGLDLKERLPLPSNLKYPPNLESPTPPMNRIRGPSPFQQSSSSQPSLPQESSSQPRARDPRLNPASDEGANTGRSLTNPPVGRARPVHPMQQARNQYQFMDRGQSRPEEHDSGVPYGNRGYLSGPQPRYNRPADYEEDIDSKSLMMSSIIGVHPSMMHGPRSILLEYDDSVPVNPPIMNPTPPAQMPQTQQRKGTNTAPPSSRRGVSSYYPQPEIQVSPIPEESIRHGSYASSHVIPSTWGSANYPAVSLPPSTSGEEDDEDNYRPMPTEDDGEQKGLVRQASLGRKSKPKITEIKSTPRQDKDSTKQTYLNTEPSPNDSSLPTRGASPPNAAPAPTKTPSPLMGFTFPVPGNYSDGNWKEAGTSAKQLGVDSDPHARTLSLYSHNMEPLNISKSMAAKMKGRKAPPPGLNLNAVRDAEARGSLTSLPDLIRRATKLAAVLETGKLRAGSSLRGSFSSSFLTNSNSISDILASFPPPFPGAGRNGSRASAWPMPSDFMDGNSNGEDSSVQIASKKGQRVCGLPLWAFILLVILALLIITAAVIVPVQLVTLSHHQKDKSSTNTEILLQCETQNPCGNGGENVATEDFCGCICTGGFSGKSCSKFDNSCVTMDLGEIKIGDTFVWIRNATMGSAIKRLFEVSTQNYNVQLDGSRVLSEFSASNVSCAAQNALVTFNGRTAPDNTTILTTTTAAAAATSSIVPTTTPAAVKRRIKRLKELTADEYDFSIVGTETQDAPTIPIPAPSTTTPAGSTATASPGNRVLALNEEVVDFSRVVILFLVQDKGLKVAVTARENLQSTFTAGVDYGNVDAGNQVSVDLENKVLNLPGGLKVGGEKTSS